MKTIIFYFFLFFLTKLVSLPLFVSLGSNCYPAHILRLCEIRKYAFPLDWVVSFNMEGLIALLQEDFNYFFNEEYLLVRYKTLTHTKYHLEFLHDGDWEADKEVNFPLFLSKYQRRIERFKSLNFYPGKVFFLRYSYPYSTSDPHRVFPNSKNIEISETDSLALFRTLKSYFPSLNFCLIIMNSHPEPTLIIEKKINPNLWMCRLNLEEDAYHTEHLHRLFFNSLNE